MKEINNCFKCGAELLDRSNDEGQGFYCPSCEEYRYRNAKPVAGVLVVKDDKVLLIKRGHEPNKGVWSFPAGYLDFAESFEKAALRELEEETGLKVSIDDARIADCIHMEHEEHYDVGIIFTAKHTDTEGVLNAGDDAEDAKFWTLEEIRKNSEEVESEEVIRATKKSFELWQD